MDEGLLESMVQDGDAEQEMLVVEEQELPQTNPEPEMGAVAAAAYDTSPPPLRQNPPILLEQSAVDMILQAMNANAKEMKEETKGMREEMQEMRGEMRQVGQCLQAGKMATPRAATNELGGSATAVRPAVAAGEDRVIRETCWARRVEVTETCTSETRREVTELTETREI